MTNLSTFLFRRLGARIALLALASTCAATASAQSDWRTTAVPFYTAAQFAQASVRDSLLLAKGWEQASMALEQGLRAYCRSPSGADSAAAATMQSLWRASATAWDRLDAVELGPLVKRRSARSVDFMPVRPAMLERAIVQAPADAASMERVGAPAKGFEALEWLLWPQVPQPGTPRCDYAVAVAGHLAREADALTTAFAAQAGVQLEQEQAEAVFSEAINQWVGGIELLRWAFMRKPLEVAQSRGDAAAFPRLRSAQTMGSWAARWQGLRAYAVLGPRATPAREGSDGLIPFETWLRSRGANALADTLVQTATAADQAIAAARPDDVPSVHAAAAALARLTALAQQDLAPALSVALGFSDADGD